MKQLAIIIALSTIFFSSKAESDTVLIFTHAFSRPDFIDIQKRTFDAFLKESYEFIVFDDASNEHMSNQIKAVCDNLNIRHIRIPQHIHHNQSPGHRHMDGIRFSLEQVGFNHDGLAMMIDSDMFMIKPFSIKEYLQGFDLAADKQGRNEKVPVIYPSPALVFFNMNTLPNKTTINFNGGMVEGNGCDVGGQMYYYLKNNPCVKMHYFGHIHIGAAKIGIDCKSCSNMTCPSCIEILDANKFDPVQKTFIHNSPDDIEFYLDNCFLHYRSGSNWNNKPHAYHMAKTNALNTLLETILKK